MKKIKTFCLGALLSLSATLAHAGIMGDLTQMFMSNSTSSSTFTTRDRVGIFGGSFSMRAPVQSINLVAFDPPRIDAGCGGIDLYGGSFSFINSQQLVQIFRQVAANAAGLAFKAAIKAISPSLDQLLTEFQTLMQHLNSLAKNTCQMAHLVVDPAEAAISGAVNSEGSVGATATGMYTDAMSTLSGYLSDANKWFGQQGQVNPKAGNGTIKSLLASGTSGIMGMAGISNIDGSQDNPSDPNSLNNKILVSMVGYTIAGVPCQKSNDSGMPDSTGTTANGHLGTISCSGPAILTLDDLIKGGGAGSQRPNAPLNLYRCVNPNGYGTPDGGFDPQPCTQMQKINFNYTGIQGWVYQNLFGNTDPGQGITSTSILGMATSGQSFGLNGKTAAGGGLTAAQQKFLKQAGVPLIPLLSKTSNPDTRIAIALRLSNYIVDCVAARMGEALYKGASGILATDGLTLTNDVKQNINNIRDDYLAKQKSCLSDNHLLQIISELNEGTRLRSANIK